MTKTIVGTNIKGGVGKTTNTQHLAVAATKLDTKARVLVIDLDPQAHITQSFAPKQEFEIYNYIDAILQFILEDPHPYDYQPQKTKHPRIDLIPSRIQLTRVQESQPFLEGNWGTHLQTVLEKFNGEYDYVFIDTAATLFKMHTLAMIASDYYFISMKPECYSFDGYKKSEQAIKTFKHTYKRTKPEFLGTILNGVTNQTRNSVEMIREVFKDTDKNLRFEVPTSPIFDQCRWEANADRPSIFDTTNKRTAPLQEAYKKIWRTMLKTMNQQEEKEAHK
jgi:cellulose biosynthesis protein BcsQ